MYVLGVWDGHDSGAALIRDNEILFASNEERYTKRKLEINFPVHSIRAALKFGNVKPNDIDVIAFPTTEFTKTMSRVFPGQKERYYQFRRRKVPKPRAEGLMHDIKYTMTGIGPLPLCGGISKLCISRELKRLGFSNPKLQPIDHHEAHAATAAFTSGMDKSLVITLDGTGDGQSGSVSTLENGELTRHVQIPTRDSIGIFYEQVTNLVGMRELEDEGKVMAMADYSFPFGYEDNAFKHFFSVKGTGITAKYGPVRQYEELARIAWRMPREQFAYMAQQILEKVVVEFVSNAVDAYGIGEVALAGGTMSNIKANMRIRELDSVKKWYIFPHMGDGGIALGAALMANYKNTGKSSYRFDSSYLGNEYSNDEILAHLKKESGFRYELDGGKSSHAAEIIEANDYILWFNGRMEYGPRALGNRSILGNANSDKVKDKLNTYVKQREWYQPFAPSMLEEDSAKLLEDVVQYDRFMTMGYKAKEEHRDILKSVVHIDMTARPQMVGPENPAYRELLDSVKKRTGYGVVLNTSFNIHGMPIVASPEDAIYTLKKTNSRYMFIGDYFVENLEAKGWKK